MRATWTILVMLGVAFLVQLPVGHTWFSSSTHAGFVGWISLETAWFALLVTLAGFALTLEQLRRTETAAETADATLKDLTKRLTTINASSEIERARSALEETQRHALGARWKNIRYSISPARDAFVRISELNIAAFDDLKDRLVAAAEEMGELSDRAETADKDYQSKLPAYIRSYLDVANKMHVRIGQA